MEFGRRHRIPASWILTVVTAAVAAFVVIALIAVAPIHVAGDGEGDSGPDRARQLARIVHEPAAPRGFRGAGLSG